MTDKHSVSRVHFYKFRVKIIDASTKLTVRLEKLDIFPFHNILFCHQLGLNVEYKIENS